MEPEEIIQQKEWIDLSASERSVLQDIAATEQEFNLMKKIFMVSREELDIVPEVDPAVFSSLEAHMISRKKRNSFYFLYAAAAILVIVLAIFLVKKKDFETEKILVKTNQKIPAVQKDSSMAVIEPAKIIQPDSQVIVKVPAPTPKNSNRPDYSDVHNNDMAINTTVASNTGLLDYVTELN